MNRPVVLALAFLLVLPALGAMTLTELISSYDYDFYDGTINVTNFSDQMVANGGVNDTLVINVTTDAATAGNYYVIVHLEDNGNLITNYSNTTLNSTHNTTLTTTVG